MTDVRVFSDPEALGRELAGELMAGIEAAGSAARRYVLGCPGGRSGRPVYRSLAELAPGLDLGHLVIAMMDEYVLPDPGGGFAPVPAEAHYSCRRFAIEEIAGPLDAAARIGLRPEHVWLPDPADPAAYEQQLVDAGGVDHFILASGASDGHVAFNRPGTPLESPASIIELAESTRRDNLGTFPEFGSLAEVPRHGVSVGLGTISRLSRRVTLVLHGPGKQEAARRVLAATDFDPAWPATFVHRCREARIWIDEAAHPSVPST